MKPLLFILASSILYGQMVAQKSDRISTVNLITVSHGSYTIIYPENILPVATAESLLKEFGQNQLTVEADMKSWLRNKLKIVGAASDQISYITFFSALPTGDCKACRKKCNGVCGIVGSSTDKECYCIQLIGRMKKTDNSITIIKLATELTNDATSLEQVADALRAGKSTSN